MSDPTIETVIRPCKYTFTPEELREIAENMAEATQKLQSLEEERKAVAASFKEQCEQLLLTMRRAARRYRDGFEMRDIECEVRRDYDALTITYIRTDTGEIAAVRPMNDAEKQMRLQDAADAAGGEKRRNNRGKNP